jgi:hypothetical protein
MELSGMFGQMVSTLVKRGAPYPFHAAMIDKEGNCFINHLHRAGDEFDNFAVVRVADYQYPNGEGVDADDGGLLELPIHVLMVDGVGKAVAMAVPERGTNG